MTNRYWFQIEVSFYCLSHFKEVSAGQGRNAGQVCPPVHRLRLSHIHNSVDQIPVSHPPPAILPILLSCNTPLLRMKLINEEPSALHLNGQNGSVRRTQNGMNGQNGLNGHTVVEESESESEEEVEPVSASLVLRVVSEAPSPSVSR